MSDELERRLARLPPRVRRPGRGAGARGPAARRRADAPARPRRAALAGGGAGRGGRGGRRRGVGAGSSPATTPDADRRRRRPAARAREASPSGAAGERHPGAADAAAAAAGRRSRCPSPEVGVPYPLDLYTHCGVFGTDIGGAWFAADPPLVEGAGNPPPGWGEPVPARHADPADRRRGGVRRRPWATRSGCGPTTRPAPAPATERLTGSRAARSRTAGGHLVGERR